jgi:hypothetical protein
MKTRTTLVAAALVVIALAISACHLSHPLTQAQVQTFISEAHDGVTYSCDVQWLQPPVCVVALRILDDAQAATIGLTSGWQAAAKAVLIKEEALLTADSRIRPYLDAVISLL